jgi:hypothetical protein
MELSEQLFISPLVTASGSRFPFFASGVSFHP